LSFSPTTSEANAKHEAVIGGKSPLPSMTLYHGRPCPCTDSLARNSSLLDQLSENRQLLIYGGTGTGSTWHALELAFRHARQSDGRRVLFLT
jgi:hypothetical protein